MLEIDDEDRDVATPPPNQAALAGPSGLQRATYATARKRKARNPREPVFRPQALRVLPEERHNETNLMLPDGKEVRGFDLTTL